MKKLLAFGPVRYLDAFLFRQPTLLQKEPIGCLTLTQSKPNPTVFRKLLRLLLRQ
jgi:hypothetical protein